MIVLGDESRPTIDRDNAVLSGEDPNVVGNTFPLTSNGVLDAAGQRRGAVARDESEEDVRKARDEVVACDIRE